MKKLLVALAFAVAGALPGAPLAAQDSATPAAIDYADDASWLCLPGREDACGQPLPTTALNANGYGSTGAARPADNPPVDCFYVYPTISRDPTLNSDMNAGPEEQGAAAAQFARFAGVCRTFAPIYRQATLASLIAAATGQNVLPVVAQAYGDVLGAWRNFLAHRNNDRPFVLIGHSQGSVHLIQLLAREIEGKPEADRMLSAILLGFNVEVPEGQAVGGSFQRTPLCTRSGQTGCVISYVSFRAEAPPPERAMFGRAARPGFTVACTNPAALGSSTAAPLDSYWFTATASGGADTIQWSSEGAPPTPFLRTEGLVSGACVNQGQQGYLAITVNADPADARTDRIPGDVAMMGRQLPDWGIHLVDMSLTQGDLIRLIEAQRDAFMAAR